MLDFPQVLETLGHVAVGIHPNDHVPRPPPRAAVATALPSSSSSKVPKVTSRPQAYKSKIRCWDCGAFGHVLLQCTKWSTGAAAARLGPTARLAATETATQHSTSVFISGDMSPNLR
jgi:Zinc knuckle